MLLNSFELHHMSDITLLHTQHNKDIIVLRRPKMTPMAADAKNIRQNLQTAWINIMPPLTDATSGRDSSSTVLYHTHRHVPDDTVPWHTVCHCLKQHSTTHRHSTHCYFTCNDGIPIHVHDYNAVLIHLPQAYHRWIPWVAAVTEFPTKHSCIDLCITA